MPGVQRLHVRFRDAGENVTVRTFNAHALLQTYTRHYYTCPLCRKSLGDFTVYFRMLDAILADERQKKKAEEEDKEDKEETKEQKQQKVKCNDCAEVTMAEFHFALPRPREMSLVQYRGRIERDE